MRQLLCTLLFVAYSAVATAQTPGPATVLNPDIDRTALMDSVFADLAAAPNAESAKEYALRLKAIWMMAPDKETAENMNRAIRAARSYNFSKALDIIDTMTVEHPDYAEGWNQRAYIHFLKGDFPKSLSNCEKVLELDPRHIGCMAGMARILIRHQKRYKAGKAQLQRATALHPFIYERVLLKEIPPGE